MHTEEFEKLVAEEFSNAVPERFRHLLRNVAFLVEEEPAQDVRRAEGLRPNETLLGYYRGVPRDARGSGYGIGGTLPDTITLYRLPLLELAEEYGNGEESLRRAIRETIWHEVGHHFGLDEHEVRAREENRRQKRAL